MKLEILSHLSRIQEDLKQQNHSIILDPFPIFEVKKKWHLIFNPDPMDHGPWHLHLNGWQGHGRLKVHHGISDLHLLDFGCDISCFRLNLGIWEDLCVYTYI